MKTDKKLKIEYFGAAESFAHIAALKRFGPKNIYIPESVISKIFEDVIKDIVDIAVVPIENSIAGTVYDTVDELVSDKTYKTGIRIEEELKSDIVLNLLSKVRLEKIKKVYSHPFPIRFCRKWMEKHLPDIPIKEINSTSEAAKLASMEENSAAIASAQAAKNYGLKLIARNIGDSDNPYVTYFFILGKSPLGLGKREKTAIAFSLEHKPGTLYRALGILAKYDINLTRIISRPYMGRLSEYRFFIEFEGNTDQKKVKNALAGLKIKTAWINVISSYAVTKLK